jgi:GTP-binding protein Era
LKSITDDYFLVGETIREKIIKLTDKEIPYVIGIEVESIDYDRIKGLTNINANIIVDKKTHKGIIIGAQGSMIKEIGTLARKDLEELYESQIMLKLFVKVEEN